MKLQDVKDLVEAVSILNDIVRNEENTLTELRRVLNFYQSHGLEQSDFILVAKSLNDYLKYMKVVREDAESFRETILTIANKPPEQV